ncbi:MAG: ABC transporter permease, partial [Solirubrobacteraceae bacterium]
MLRLTLSGMRARKLRLALTALAIVLGVTFVTGTLVLSDTLNSTFNAVIGTAYQHISFEVRGAAQFGSAVSAANSSDRRPVPASLLSTVRRIPGVAYAFGSVGGYAQYLDRSGNAIGGGHGSTLGFSYDPNPALSPYKLVQGRPPTGPDQLVMDKATADKHDFRVGDRVLVNLPDRAMTFTISGIVTFGSADNLAGITLAGFDAATATRLFHSQGRYGSIEVLATHGSDQVRLQRAIARVLPKGYEVVSGKTLTSELSNEVGQALSFISTALLIFAAIALFVGAFTIFNTFSITVGQRTRELALLRVVGASRAQLLRSVLGEAALTGLAASLIGLGLGVGAAAGLKALLGAFGVTLPSAALVFKVRTVVVALAVGITVTVLAAVVPARRAVAVAPVAALGGLGGETPARRRRSALAGAAAGLAGL